MNEQIRDDKNRIARLIANAHIHGLHAVFRHAANDAAQLHRNGCPLIFFDAAVVVRLKQRHAVVFIQRNRANINARRVQMRSRQIDAAVHAIRTDYKEYNCFISIYFVIFFSRMDFLATGICCKAVCLCHSLQAANRVTLGLCFVQERLVPFRVLHHGSLLGIAHSIPAGLFVIK